MMKSLRCNHKDFILSFLLCTLLVFPCFYRVFKNGQEPIWYLFSAFIVAMPMVFTIQRIRRYWLFVAVVTFFLVSPFVETFLIVVYQDFIRTGNFLSVLTTNKRESGNFVANNHGILLYEIPVILLYISTLVARKRGRALATWRPALFSLLPTVLLAFCGFAIRSCPPYNLYSAVFSSATLLSEKKLMLPEGDKMLFGAKRSDVPGKEVYVFAVGESMMYEHTTFSGYKRNTTPLLAANENLVSFPDYTSPSTLTYFSVPIMLSRATAHNFNVSFKEKTVISAFKETGFKCYVVVSSGKLLSHSPEITRGADEVICIPRDKDFAHVIDSVSSIHPKTFFVLQMLQCHSYYNNFEPEFDFYHPNLVSDRQAPLCDSLYINAYDNTVHYTDYILDNIIRAIDKPDVRSTLIFASDHGEILRTKGSRRGTSLNPTPEEYHVPMFFWYSDAWAQSHAQQVKNLREHQSKRVNADNLFYTACQMADIQLQPEHSKDDWSILSSSFAEHKRRLLLPDGHSTINVDRKRK